MPKRTDIESILLIGSGPIVIGQACEFDYSGTQACRVLLDEGYRVVLANSNPATIMTDPEFADATYIEPPQPGGAHQHHPAGAARRAAAHIGRADRAEPGHGADRGGSGRQVRSGGDRRQPERDINRRGPGQVPPGHDRHRAARAPPRPPPTPWTRRWRSGSASGCR